MIKLLLTFLVVIMFSMPLMAEGGEGTGDTNSSPKNIENIVKEKQEVKKAPVKKTKESNSMKVAGGVELLSESVIGNRIVTDFYQRASLFVFGNIKPKKLGYFIHLMSAKDPYLKGDTDTKFTTAVAFVWINPVKFLNLRFGELKKPGETTYLPCWSVWMFERPPMGFGLLGKEKMVGVESGVQLIAKYKKLISLQFNAFRTDASLTSNPYFNLLYFVGLKVTPTFGKVKTGLFANYSFEPHAGLFVTENDGTTTAVKRNTITTGIWVKAYNVDFYAQYIDYNREKTTTSNVITNPESSDLLVQLAYDIPVKSITIRPKLRYDMLDPNVAGTGDGKTSIVVGADTIFATGPRFLEYRMGLEYQINQEESGDTKNDVLRFVFEVAHF